MYREESVKRLKDWGNYNGISSRINDDINEFKELIKKGRELSAVRYDKHNTKTGISKPTEGAAIRNGIYEEEIKALEKKLEELNENRQLVESFLDTLDVYDRRMISLRYLRKKSWDYISMNTYLSVRQCFRKHNRILTRFDEFCGIHKNRA